MKAGDTGCLRSETAKVHVTCSNTAGNDNKVLLPYFICFFLKLKAFSKCGKLLAKRELKRQEKITKYTADAYQSYSLIHHASMNGFWYFRLFECLFFYFSCDVQRLFYNFIFHSVNRCVGKKCKASE